MEFLARHEGRCEVGLSDSNLAPRHLTSRGLHPCTQLQGIARLECTVEEITGELSGASRIGSEWGGEGGGWAVELGAILFK
jgi:hypothetical protein